MRLRADPDKNSFMRAYTLGLYVPEVIPTSDGSSRVQMEVEVIQGFPTTKNI